MAQTSVQKRPNYLVRRIFQLLIAVLLMMGILFISAGELKWPGAWIFLAGYLGMIAVNAVFILPRGMELIEERAQFHKDVVSWDNWISTLLIFIGQFGGLLVAGLDRRLGWSPMLPVWLLAVGGLLMAAGYGMSSWAMITNRFFSTHVRLQVERAHQVVDTGPYRFIRHPGYFGMFIALPGTVLLLGSLWALIPAGIGMVLTAARTYLEDRYLHVQLSGYKEYAGRVRFRLIPGIW